MLIPIYESTSSQLVAVVEPRKPSTVRPRKTIELIPSLLATDYVATAPDPTAAEYLDTLYLHQVFTRPAPTERAFFGVWTPHPDVEPRTPTQMLSWFGRVVWAAPTPPRSAPAR